jgi:hypothetical protein
MRACVPDSRGARHHPKARGLKRLLFLYRRTPRVEPPRRLDLRPLKICYRVITVILGSLARPCGRLWSLCEESENSHQVHKRTPLVAS